MLPGNADQETHSGARRTGGCPQRLCRSTKPDVCVSQITKGLIHLREALSPKLKTCKDRSIHAEVVYRLDYIGSSRSAPRPVCNSPMTRNIPRRHFHIAAASHDDPMRILV